MRWRGIGISANFGSKGGWADGACLHEENRISNPHGGCAAILFPVLRLRRYADLIHSIKSIIETLGLRVYVDWIEDAGLDRSQVTTRTAKVLRERMKTCSCLVYAHSSNATESAWMPWELGYFDGLKPSHVWILPLVSEHDSEFKGQEYLGFYPPLHKLTALPGRLNLGFLSVGEERAHIPLAKAAGGAGVYYPG